jgi:hypothetical protein
VQNLFNFRKSVLEVFLAHNIIGHGSGAYVFSLTKLEKRAEQVLSGREGVWG